MLHQCLQFHTRAMRDDPGLTIFCRDESDFCGCGKDEGVNGSDHEHRKFYFVSRHIYI